MPIAPARSPLPPFVEPQLATLVPKAPEGDDWIHELKFDGYRILARVDQGRVTLLSRRAKDWTPKFPGVRDGVARLPARTALIDGEVAVPLPDGRTSFQALQNALGRNGAGAVYYVFDLLHLDGRDLRGEPLEARKQALKDLLAGAPAGLPVFYSDHVVGHGNRFLAQARERGLEGIVSKKRRDPHRTGRSLGWLKAKCILRQEFVIGGFTEPEGSREALGAILIGYYDAGKLVFAGKVGTGFSQAVLRDLRRRLGRLAQAECPFAERPPAAFIGRTAHWTRPELVAEVAFIEWTHDGRLRHPSFQGLREDKPARDVVREIPSAEAARIATAAGRSAAARTEDEESESESEEQPMGASADEQAPDDDADSSAGTGKSSKTRPRAASKARPTAAAKGTAASSRTKKAAASPPFSASAHPPGPSATRKRPPAASPESTSSDGGSAASVVTTGLKKGEAAVLGQRLSNPDRVYYPELGLTKLDLARYYEAVGEAMLPHVQTRPLSLVRCPEGIAGTCFYVKHMKLNHSPTLTQIAIRESKKTSQYLAVDTVEGLVTLAQMGMLEVHIWNSTRDHLENPDRFVLDLDPGPEVPWAETVQAAQLCRKTLEQVGLESFVKTTGGKGLHVVVPIVPDFDWDSCLSLSRAIAELIVRQRPREYTTDMPKAGRERKILIDYYRNVRGATSVAAFSTRKRPEATVSVPIGWDELHADLRPDTFTMKSVPERLASLRQDPWKRYFTTRQAVPRDLARLMRSSDGPTPAPTGPRPPTKGSAKGS